MQTKAQGAIEYLLIIGAAILVVALVIIALTSVTTTGTQSVGEDDAKNVLTPLEKLNTTELILNNYGKFKLKRNFIVSYKERKDY